MEHHVFKYMIITLVALVVALGVLLKFERDANQEKTELNGKLTGDNLVLSMEVATLKNTRFVDSKLQEELEESNVKTHTLQTEILEKVTHGVETIQNEPLAEDGSSSDSRISRIALRVTDGVWESYCEAVPSDVDCANRHAAKGLSDNH